MLVIVVKRCNAAMCWAPAAAKCEVPVQKADYQHCDNQKPPSRQELEHHVRLNKACICFAVPCVTTPSTWAWLLSVWFDALDSDARAVWLIVLLCLKVLEPVTRSTQECCMLGHGWLMACLDNSWPRPVLPMAAVSARLHVCMVC